ncbi:MAG: FtsX-like permease family protein, partial [Gemmatimonadaceae bacterium]
FQASMSMSIRVPGWDSIPRTKGGSPNVSYVSDDYFNTTGARILSGRAFTEADGKGSEPVAIVSQTMATTLWPNKQALGSCFYASTDSLTPCSRIIGIVTDAHRFELEEAPSMHYYIPWAQYKYPGATMLLVRPRGNPNATVSAIRRAALEVDPTISYVHTSSLQESIDPKVRPWQLGANIFVLMGILALCVAAIGLYSVMSYLVAQRRQELGIRMALGASSRDIIRLIMASGIGTAGIGVAIGVVAALLGGRFIQPLLFKTSAHDVTVFSTVVLSLIGVSVLASLVPALRARRVNPIEALRTE